MPNEREKKIKDENDGNKKPEEKSTREADNGGIEEEKQKIIEKAEAEVERLKQFNKSHINSGLNDPEVVKHSQNIISNSTKILNDFVSRVSSLTSEKYRNHMESNSIKSLQKSFEKFQSKIYKIHDLERNLENDKIKESKKEKVKVSIDKLYENLYKKMLPSLKKYQEADKPNPKKWEYAEKKLADVLSEEINFFAKKDKIDEALDLWQYCPAKVNISSGPASAIITAVLREVKEKESGKNSFDEHIEKRLEKFPDLRLSHFLSISGSSREESYTTPRGYSSKNDEKILKLLAEMRENPIYKKVNHSWPVHEIKIMDLNNEGHILKDKLDEDSRKQIFEAHNSGERIGVLKQMDIFQDDFDQLDKKARLEFLSDMRTDKMYDMSVEVSGLGQLMSYNKINKAEFDVLWKKYNWHTDSKLTVEDFKKTLENKNPLAFFTNPELLNADKDFQNDLIRQVIEDGNNSYQNFYKTMYFFRQILSRRDKYPDIDFPEIERNFTNLIASILNEDTLNWNFNLSKYIYLERLSPSKLIKNEEYRASIDKTLEKNLRFQLEILREKGVNEKSFFNQ